MTEMAERNGCKTIYMSAELKQANDSECRGSRDIPIPEVKPHSSHRLNYVQSHDRGLRRSFGSTDLLHNAHPHSHIALASDSADSLEGAVPLHADSSGERRRVDKPQSATNITPVSLDDLELPVAGEGISSYKRVKTGVKSLKDEEEEEEDKWVDASEIRLSPAEGREEEEDEEASPLPIIGQAGKKHQGVTTTEDSTYLQDFRSLPKSLVPSEITHCLHMLEEECRGVEKESESVKWKMEFIHSSMQCVQETLRTLLIRLVEAQSNDHLSRDATSNLFPPPPPPPIYPLHPSNTSEVGADPSHAGPHHAAHTHQHHHLHHHLPQCKAPHPVPSKTCLMDALNPGHCCQGALSADMPSCAQRAKERSATFSAITELRADVERLRVVHLEERREQKEALRVLKDFQRQVEDLISAQRAHQEGSSEPFSDQLQQLKQEVQDVANMTRQAMAVLNKLGVQLDNMDTKSEHSTKCDS
ncbi:hypothetical protein AALO_G00299170 [Alosa alosa]|uniref:Uncharacterized protein n=1 Tax=Alosa alosa TaxID=278164 RepID=A0AAV6FIQ9_9TELE|nr:uncharacterized protein LOC125289880 [Alosa alosa]KAG5261027.1 hypothetical protein AALO_G00299170 [Alosa alosa]